MFALATQEWLEHFGRDLLATSVFGVVLVLLVAFGCKLADWIWKKLDLQEEVHKGNIAAGIVMGSIIIGLCYAMSQVIVGILG